MSAPLSTPRSTEELRSDRDQVEKEMYPYTVAMLRRFREVDALEFKKEELLDRYEALSWLIEDWFLWTPASYYRCLPRRGGRSISHGVNWEVDVEAGYRRLGSGVLSPSGGSCWWRSSTPHPPSA